MPASTSVTSPLTTQARVAQLRTLAETDPQAAQDAVWTWIQRLGTALPSPEAEFELTELFAGGEAADVDGQTDGILVGWTTPAGLDRTGRIIVRIAQTAIGFVGVPWLGKKFDKSTQRGTNSLPFSAVAATAVLAPTYRMKRTGDHWEGFDMLNRVEDSVVTPGTPVLVLDYETIGTNPWPINQIRDEAVQIVPGTYLGAKIWHQADGYRQVAFWAARSPLS